MTAKPTAVNRLRRTLLLGIGAGTIAARPIAALSRPKPGAARVVIVGGGFAGGACARWLRRLVPEASITVVEPQRALYTGFFCNTVLAGLRRPEFIRQIPGGLRRFGIAVLEERVVAVEPERRRLRLASGATLDADIVVLCCGVRMRDDAIAGFDAAAMRENPPAWPGSGADLERVAARLRALPERPRIAVSVPAAPYRCPPGPYERVSLFAHWLQRHRPGARITILDAKDAFSKDALFLEAWAKHYPGMIEWRGRQDGGELLRYEPGCARTASGERLRVDWLHVIPAQAAGALAVRSGLTGADGWIPVRATDFGVPGTEGVYALGDAAQVQPMPKSAFAAVNQARQCALAVAARLRDAEFEPGLLANTCYSMVSADAAFSVSSLYVVEGGVLRVVNAARQLSPVAASEALRASEAEQADALYRWMTASVYGG